MSLSTCIKCGGHIPLGPDASNRCENCGQFVFGPPASNLESELCRAWKARAMEAESRIRELEAVIRWALGEVGDFPTRQDGQGPYWWRKELRKRASLEIKPCTKICGS